MNTVFRSVKAYVAETDKLLFFLCVLVSSFGVLMVHSATRNTLADDERFSRDTIIMMIAIGIGILLCLLISSVDYALIIKMWPVITLVCVALMLSLFVWGVGPDYRSDAKSWLQIAGVNFQPSELLKIGFIITFTFHLDTVKDRVNTFKNIVFLCLHGMLPVGLVILTGDLGSALVFVAIFIGMLFIAGVHFRYFAGGFAICLVAIPMLWISFFSEFQKQRFLAVYYPKAMSEAVYKALIYQQQQSINAIGSGQLLGKGLFSGSFTQNGMIPVDESDMIFAVIGEELGFWGCAATLLILAMVIGRVVTVGNKAKDNIGSLVCFGTALMIGAQSIINIGMCLKLLPCIGITLPFISSGGSSNLCVYIGIGTIMSIYRANHELKPVNFRLSHIRTPFSEQ